MLSGVKRIAVKIGSALLVEAGHGLRAKWLASMVNDIAELIRQGHEVILVSSGAIATGRGLLSLPPRDLKLEESQAAAAVGQIMLSQRWSEAFGHYDIKTGQVLLTLEDTENRRRYLNARATIGTLLKYGVVPIINENDTVATNEIRYGDNDRLAARVATMMNADMLVLLSDIDGLYTAPPGQNKDAQHLSEIEAITAEIEAMAGSAASNLSRGGMRTKIDAAKIATRAGTKMIIADGREPHPLRRLADGATHTLFHASEKPVSAWQNWISGHLEPAGALTIDDGALRAIESGSSLLPAGVRGVTGNFSRGDTVSVRLESDYREVARGLSAYSSKEAEKIAGHKTEEIFDLLGYAPRSAMVHRDDLAFTKPEVL